MSKRLFIIATVVAMLCFGAIGAFAQENPTGNIQGLVTDPQGLAVPAADITVTFTARGITLTTQSDANGRWAMTNLTPGAYEVKVAHTGFNTFDAKALEVIVGQTYTLNAKLTLGTEGKVVEIQAGAQVLQTQDSKVQHEVTGNQVTQIPITSRNAQDLAIFMPDLQTTGTPRSSSFDGLPPGALDITYDGIESQDEINKSTSTSSFFSVSQPRIDDVDEFNVTTSAGDATQNGEGAVQLAIVSKKGTNQWHGGGWWYKRNGGWNANNFFTNQTGNPRQVIQLNEFGYKIGGPILKNKLFFFTDWDQWENPSSLTRTRTILSDGALAGTGDAAHGQFTYSVGSGQPVPTTTQLENIPWIACNTSLGTCTVNVIGQAASGAESTANSLATHLGIPNTIDPFEAGLIASVSPATLTAAGVKLQPASGAFNTDNASYNVAVGSHRRYPDARLDYQINKTNSLEYDVHYAYYNDTPDTLNNADPNFPVAPYSNAFGAQTSNRTLMALAWRWQVSPTMNNELRIGTEVDPVGFFVGETPSIYPAVNTNLGAIRIRPSVAGGTNPFLAFQPQADSGNLFQGNETLSFLKGNHNFSVGGTISHVMYRARFSNSAVGSLGLGLAGQDPVSLNNDFSYSVASATSPSATSCLTTTNNSAGSILPNTCAIVNDNGSAGSDLGSLESYWADMAGRVTSFSATQYLNLSTQAFQTGQPQLFAINQNETGVFFQDNFRFRPTMSLNYGLRWEWQSSPSDALDEYYYNNGGLPAAWGVSGVLNFEKPNLIGGENGLGGATLLNGAPFYDSYKKAFAPTLGFAWTPSDIGPEWMRPMFGHGGQTVFRIGYSIAYDREGTGTYTNSINTTGLSNTAGYVANSTSTIGAGQFQAGSIMQSSIFTGAGVAVAGSPALGGVALTNPAYGTPIPLNLSGASGANTQVAIFSPNLRPANVQSWNAGIQRQINRDTSIEVRYVGNHASGLFSEPSINQVNIYSNGFLNEFNIARSNLAINGANLGAKGALGTAGVAECNLGIIVAPKGGTCLGNAAPIQTFADLQIAGDQPVPISTASFTGTTSLTSIVTATNNGNSGSLTSQANTNFSSSTFINDLNRGVVGSMASSLNSLQDWENLAGCSLNAAGGVSVCTGQNGYNENFWIPNPEARGGSFIQQNLTQSTYNALQVELRRRMHNGMQFDANYSYSKSLSNGGFFDLNAIGAGKAPSGSDLRNVFKFENLTEIPLGEGHMLKTGNSLIDRHIIGGWEWDGIMRWQSGDLFSTSGGLGGTVTGTDGGVMFGQGLTTQALQASFGTEKLGNIPGTNALPGPVLFVPSSETNATRQSVLPSILSACNTPGAWCAHPYFYGPNFFKADWGLLKTEKLTEKVSMTVRANFLDIFNNINFSTPSSGSVATSTSFGKITGDYSDFTSTQDPGGRVLEGQLRFNF